MNYQNVQKKFLVHRHFKQEKFLEPLQKGYSNLRERLNCIIIQQIVTMPIYGKEALNICHPTWQISCDIRKWPYLEVHCRFSFIACLAAILKSEAVLAVFSVNFNSLEETFHG